jgi:anthranilate synthase component 2
VEPAAGIVVVVDNHDSFTFNIVQALQIRGVDCRVVASSSADVDALLSASAIVLSAGPCTPAEAGMSLQLIAAAAAAPTPPSILGICLGHQVIAQAFGAKLQRSVEPRHGEIEAIRHDGRGLHQDLPNPLQVARYNSLVIDADSLPAELEASAWTARGELMAFRHSSLPFIGLQYHPESHLCPQAAAVFDRWLAS